MSHEGVWNSAGQKSEQSCNSACPSTKQAVPDCFDTCLHFPWVPSTWHGSLSSSKNSALATSGADCRTCYPKWRVEPGKMCTLELEPAQCVRVCVCVFSFGSGWAAEQRSYRATNGFWLASARPLALTCGAEHTNPGMKVAAKANSEGAAPACANRNSHKTLTRTHAFWSGGVGGGHDCLEHRQSRLVASQQGSTVTQQPLLSGHQSSLEGVWAPPANQSVDETGERGRGSAQPW